MKVTVTEKLRLSLEPEDVMPLVEAFTAACNFVAREAESFPRRGNAAALQAQWYQEVRQRFGLSAQYTCSVFRVVSGKYQTNRRSVPTFVREWPTLQKGKDYSFVRTGLGVSLLNERRKNIGYSGNGGRVEALFRDYTPGGARLHVKRGRVYLELTFSREVPEATAGTTPVIGVDMGMKSCAVTSTRRFIKTSSQYQATRAKVRKTRSSLQSRKDTGGNTHSVRRALKRLSGREARLTRNEMHVTSKNLLAHAVSQGATRVVFEDVAGIRKGRWNHGWSFHMFRTFAEYKLTRAGIVTEEVDPAYTSQACSRCGHTEKGNRKKSAFKCLHCGYSLNADLNAAYNIRMRSIVLRQVPEEAGDCQHAPEAREGASAPKSSVASP